MAGTNPVFPGARQGFSGDCEESICFRLGYRRWLDGLRGVAILLVLALHLKLVDGGWIGVDIFFVLSGFLITTLLAQEWERSHSIRFGRFYLRRGLRLFPALFFMMFIHFSCTFLFRPPEEAAGLLREVVVAACYVTNWPAFHHTNMQSLVHTWSLSVEEQFYLLWPPILFLLLRSGLTRRRAILIVGLTVFALAVARHVNTRLRPRTEPGRSIQILQMYVALHTRADPLLIGCAIGLLATGNLLPRSARFRAYAGRGAVVSFAILAVMIGITRPEQPQVYYGFLTAIALMIGVILVRLLLAPMRIVTPLLESRVLVGVGRISYSLYLVQIPLLHWLQPLKLGWSAPANMALFASLSFLAALISYVCVERPFLRLKDRLHTPKAETRVGRAPEGVSQQAA